MRTLRNRSRRYHFSSILRRVLTHPNNKGRRARAVARAAGWQIRKRLTDSPADFDLFGFRIRCYPGSSEASKLFYFGPWFDWNEMGFISKYLREGDGFIDGGANIGIYSLLAASLVGKTGRIDAFEPAPSARERLRENIARNNLSELVTIHDVALGHTKGTALFSLDWDVSNRILTNPTEVRGRTTTVRMIDLDSELSGRYALGKLDLEGAEMAALKGAKMHLREANPPVWMVEALTSLVRKSGHGTRSDLLAFLREFGFRLAVYDDGLRFEEEIVRETPNFLAIHETRLDEVIDRISERQ